LSKGPPVCTIWLFSAVSHASWTPLFFFVGVALDCGACMCKRVRACVRACAHDSPGQASTTVHLAWPTPVPLPFPSAHLPFHEMCQLMRLCVVLWPRERGRGRESAFMRKQVSTSEAE
jgi:hypothetical protein